MARTEMEEMDQISQKIQNYVAEQQVFEEKGPILEKKLVFQNTHKNLKLKPLVIKLPPRNNDLDFLKPRPFTPKVVRRKESSNNLLDTCKNCISCHSKVDKIRNQECVSPVQIKQKKLLLADKVSNLQTIQPKRVKTEKVELFDQLIKTCGKSNFAK